MKSNIQTLIELFNNLNDDDKLILYNYINNIVYSIKQNNIKKDIDYEEIMNLSWF